jgi:hypothetical protein
MMKPLTLALLVSFGALATTGCIHDRRPGRTVVVKEKRGGCAPAHHWNGRACVHNGNAKGHKK